MSLDRYRHKRDFARTPEPGGSKEAARPEDRHRFVVQRHRARRLHYDFRLEIDGVLVSWAIPKAPSMNPSDRRMAVHVEDHPVEYIDFEGVIPKGEYGAGDVIVWDRGTFEPEATDDPAAAVAAGELKFSLQGEKLRGRFTIVRTGRDQDGRDSEAWLLIKKRDEMADESWNIDDHPRSVLSGRTNDEVAARKPAIWNSGAAADEATIRLDAAIEAPLPEFVEPMMATLASRPFSDPDWLFEVKWDGYRVEAVIRDGSIRLWTRRRQDAAAYFPELARQPTWIAAREAIVDGEVVALDSEGRPRFALLQARLGGLHGTGRKAEEAGELAYQVFDLLHHDGRSLLDVPLEERKRLLRSVLRDHRLVRYAGHVERDGEAFFEAAAAKGLEGIVAKLRRSRYEAGRRSTAWLKLKIRGEQEVLIAGWLPRKGSTQDLGSLIAAVYDGDKLVHAGQVGTGFDAATRADLLARLRPLARPDSPFAVAPSPRLPEARWVEPKLVARVAFAEWTRDGRLRAPSFLGLEPERDPRTVTREVAVSSEQAVRQAESDAAAADPPDRPEMEPVGDATRSKPAEGGRPQAATVEELAALDALGANGSWSIAGRTLALTNLDKVLFPARDDAREDRTGGREGGRGGRERRREAAPAGGRDLTKRDLIRYLVQIAPVMLPHLADRALNLHRYPNGAGKPGFWQKDLPETAPSWLRRWLETGVEEREANHHLVADEVATMGWLGNQAAFEIHAWTSKIQAPDRPTFALIDIDPGTKTTWEEILILARLFRTALEHLHVVGFPKVTGRRGLQVWIPIRPRYSFGETSAWVEQVSRAVGASAPELVSWEWEVARRRGLARLDYTQNASIKTLVAPYAVRPAPGAPVSAPIDWDELDDPDLRSDRWTIETILDRVRERGDLFAPALNLPQELPRL